MSLCFWNKIHYTYCPLPFHRFITPFWKLFFLSDASITCVLWSLLLASTSLPYTVVTRGPVGRTTEHSRKCNTPMGQFFHVIFVVQQSKDFFSNGNWTGKCFFFFFLKSFCFLFQWQWQFLSVQIVTSKFIVVHYKAAYYRIKWCWLLCMCQRVLLLWTFSGLWTWFNNWTGSDTICADLGLRCMGIVLKLNFRLFLFQKRCNVGLLY